MSVENTYEISGNVVCWCVVFVLCYVIMVLLMMLTINVPMWLVYEYQSVECAFTSPVIKIVLVSVIFMQFVMYVYNV